MYVCSKNSKVGRHTIQLKFIYLLHQQMFALIILKNMLNINLFCKSYLQIMKSVFYYKKICKVKLTTLLMVS